VVRKIIKAVTCLQIPAMKQDPSRPITNGWCELSSKLCLATSGVSCNCNKPLANAGVNFAEKSASQTDVRQYVRHYEWGVVATGSQFAWEFCQPVVGRSWSIGKLSSQEVKVASFQGGMSVGKGSGNTACEASDLNCCFDEGAGQIPYVTAYSCGLCFESVSKLPQIIPSFDLR
jgi:hypothetical protein